MAVTDLKSCTEYIRKWHANHPPEIVLTRVVVSKRTLNRIRKELQSLSFVTPGKRPTYGPPYGAIDRQLWDELQYMMKQAPVKIMGVDVVNQQKVQNK